MCGIAGIVWREAAHQRELSGRVEHMLDALAHRGPDGRGVWTAATRDGGAVALGHTRLAIIDLSPAGQQPMARRDLAVTCNGEIYNYRELRAQLSDGGAEFCTASDTEVLLAAAERWPETFIEKLYGMFACALWDSQKQTLTLARDRFGIKPLYYAQTDSCFVFASEVRALLASGLIDARLDESAVWHYLGYQTTPTPATMLRGIQMLDAGSMLQVAANGSTTHRRYWDLLSAARVQSVPVSRQEAQRRVTTLLEESVTSHLVSDVPVGVFLSAGIDSAALVSTMSSLGVRPETFTVSLDDAELDESRTAQAVAKEFGAGHTCVHLRGDDIVDALPSILAATDHPSGDGVNSYIVSEAVHRHGLKVALSGLGGDEIFGGYPSFSRLDRVGSAATAVARAPVGVRRAAASVLRSAGQGSVATEKAAAVLESDGSVASLWPVTRQLFSERARTRMLSSRVRPQADAYRETVARALDGGGTGLYAQVSFAETRAYMHDVLLRDTDQMSMAHALEVRVPLLDHRLAAFVVALPDQWKRPSPGLKPLLTDSLRRPLPPAVATGPKRGFVLPFDAWMRGPLRSYCERQLGARGLDARDLLKPGEATRLWKRFLARTPGVTWSRVWILVALNAWLDRRSL